MFKAPVKVPVKVLVKVHVEVKVKAPVKVPAKVPVKVLVKVHVKVKVKAPVKVPAKVHSFHKSCHLCSVKANIERDKPVCPKEKLVLYCVALKVFEKQTVDLNNETLVKLGRV